MITEKKYGRGISEVSNSPGVNLEFRVFRGAFLEFSQKKTTSGLGFVMP